MEYVYMIVFSGPRLSRWYEIHRHWALWDSTDVERKGQFESERESWKGMRLAGWNGWRWMSEWRWRWGWMCVLAIAMAVGNTVLAIGDTFPSLALPHLATFHHIPYTTSGTITSNHTHYLTLLTPLIARYLAGWLAIWLFAIWLSILSARYLPRWSVA